MKIQIAGYVSYLFGAFFDGRIKLVVDAANKLVSGVK
jgi:hypothetical protein